MGKWMLYYPYGNKDLLDSQSWVGKNIFT
ncbi:protein of unknown function [Methanoculleus bourgensis]|uniref:Uncharacterized protein n=1 Tax=Methanoculleus bourgensis TaxID=83986 RepID=A0A0X3BP00_9EURY|nr:protein of unknown function [Methanoculleus bourgensis]